MLLPPFPSYSGFPFPNSHLSDKKNKITCPRTFVYTRISTKEQSDDSQRTSLQDFITTNHIPNCIWISEQISGFKTTWENRRISEIIHHAVRYDRLLVFDISRLSRKMLELNIILGKCLENGVSVYALKNNLLLTDDLQSKIYLQCLSMSSEIERTMISERIKSGLANAKKNGKILGRKKGSLAKSLLHQHRDTIISMLIAKKSQHEISSLLGCTQPNLCKYIKRYDLMSLAFPPPLPPSTLN